MLLLSSSCPNPWLPNEVSSLDRHERLTVGAENLFAADAEGQLAER
jgi:hypothetical protein